MPLPSIRRAHASTDSTIPATTAGEPAADARPGRRTGQRLGHRRAVALGVQFSLLAAALAGTFGFVAVHHDHDVRITVDGQTRTVSTTGSTVRAALASAHLTVGQHDLVAPALDSRLAAGDDVVLRHGRAIRLTEGSTTRVVWVTATDVGQALDQLGLADTGAYVSASRSRTIGLGGLALDVRLPQKVTVVHDGVTTAITTTDPTILTALTDNLLPLGPQDVLSVPKTSVPVNGSTVKITRVRKGQVSSDSVIPPTVQRVPDGSMYVGQTTVVDPGQDGVIRTVYGVLYADGKLVGQEPVSRTQTQAMRPEVVHYGTAARPKPTYDASNTGGLNWAALANCESGGNPSEVSADGQYYGLYQFSLSTWQSVGGSGRPSDASSSEQTYRAEKLYGEVGRSAWPVCGQYL